MTGASRSYEDDEDLRSILDILGAVTEDFNWVCHAYCLMCNQYHLLVETPDGNLAKGMRQLNGVYMQWSNRHHRRVGHLFQGRYKAVLVDKNAYLLGRPQRLLNSSSFNRHTGMPADPQA